MAKALAIGASIAAIAAVTVVTGGAALGLGVALSTSAFGVSAGSLLAASAVLSTGSSLLAPKPKAPAGLSQSDRLTVSINVREPRKIVFGSTAMATDLRDQEWTSDQTYLHRFIVLASHRINAVREIWFDDKLAWTAAGGAQGEFARWLQVTPVLEGSAANAINIGPRMGGARRFTGCAYVHLRYQILANSKKLDSVFNQSIPSRVTIVGDGASVYDPRRDSTVPGGSGPQRANDQSTWAWNASAARNPALCTLFYLLGWRINGKLAVGKGIPPARIDLASFIEAANLCDEPVAKSAGGTEPRYRCDGVISEGDDTQAVLDNLKATMNAVLDDVDGRLRVSVLHNDLAAPIGDLFTGDVLGAFTWQQTLPLNDSVSVIRGTFTDPSPASLYQSPDYPEVTIASRDGIERSQTVNYPLVQSPSQAQRLSKQRLQRMLYGGTFSAVFQSTAWKFQKGDVIRLTFAPLGWDRKLFRIADMATQVDGKVPMMLREEHAAIYAWDASDAAPVAGAEPTRYDPALWPLTQGITEAGTTAEWDKVNGPNKPDDNATNSADPNSPFGPDRTVGQMLAKLEAIEDIEAPAEALTLLKRAAADREAAERQMQRALDLLGQAILRITGEASLTREILRDAGAVVDPTTGKVRIYALDLLAERTNARLTLVDQTLDAVNGRLTSKVERTEFNELASDVGLVEQVLSSAGGASGLSFTARQARLANNDGAQAGLRALLSGDAADRRRVVQIAEVRQEVFAKIIDAQTAEAFARQLLNVQIGAVDVRLATEILTRIEDGKAFARDISALKVTADNLTTEIAKVDEARIEGDKATVRSTETLIASSEKRSSDAIGKVAGDANTAIGAVDRKVVEAEAAIGRVAEAVTKGDKANAETIDQVRGEVGKVAGSVSDIRRVVVGPEGASVRAMTVLNNKGRISGVSQTNDGRVAAFEVTADRFGVYDPDTDERLFYVDADGAIAARFKTKAIGGSNLKDGAAQGSVFYTTPQNMVIPRGSTGQPIIMTFDKEEDGTVMELLFYGHFIGEDDLQLDCRFIVDGAVKHVEPVNLILIDFNAELTITPFHYVAGLAAGRHTISIEIYNREADNRSLTVAAGATLKCTELRLASVGSGAGSMGQVVAGSGTGGGGGGSGGGGGGSGGGGGVQPVVQN